MVHLLIPMAKNPTLAQLLRSVLGPIASICLLYHDGPMLPKRCTRLRHRVHELWNEVRGA